MPLVLVEQGSWAKNIPRYECCTPLGGPDSAVLRAACPGSSKPGLAPRLTPAARFASCTLAFAQHREPGMYQIAHLLEDFLCDLRFGLRQLRRNPFVSAVCVLTLALGIGANAAIFSAVHAVLLRPLSFKDPDRL